MLRSRSRVGRSFARARGAVVVYVAFFLGVLLAAGTLAIDIGRLYGAQRELQRAANVAALDAAAVSGGCYGNFGGDLQDDPLGLAQGEVTDSLARNALPASYVSSVQIGKLFSENGVRRFEELSPGEDVNARTAVQVTLTRPTPQRILPFNQGPVMVARAAADSRPRVTIGVASSTADVNLLNGVLGNLGLGVGLSVASYQALLGANVRLAQLAVDLGVGSVDDLLDSNTSLPLDDVLNALGQGQTGTVATILHQLAAGVNAPDVVLGDVIAAPLGLGQSGADAVVNVGQLVSSLAQAANGQNLIDISPALNLGAAGVVGLTATAHVRLIEPPKTAIIWAGVTPMNGNQTSYGSDTYASTAQALVEIDLKFAPLGGVLANIHLPLYLQLAKSTASLDEIRCARSGQPQHEVDLFAQASLASVGLGTFDDINAPNPQPSTDNIKVATVLGGGLLSALTITLQTSPIQAVVGSNTETLEFTSDFPSAYQQVSTPVGSGVASAVSSLSAANLQVCVGTGTGCGSTSGLGFLVTGLLNTLIGTVKPLLNTVLAPVLSSLDAILEPLLDTLGISAGNGNFQVISLDPVNSTEINPGAEDQLSLQAFLFNH